MWDIKQIITLKYRQCDKLSLSRWSDVNAIFLAVPARKIATSNHLEIDSSSHHRILRWLFAYYTILWILNPLGGGGGGGHLIGEQKKKK